MLPVSRAPALAFMALACAPALALTPLEDGDLREVNGAGVGLVLQNYQLSVDPGSSWRFGTSGTTAELVFSQFWWCPSSGNTAATSATCNNAGSATLGRTNDPVYFDVNQHSGRLRNGSIGTRAALTLAAPQNTLNADLMDASYLMTLDHAAPYTDDLTRVTSRKMDIDGSNIRLWSEPGVGLAWTADINLTIDSLTFDVNATHATPSYGNFRLGPCPTTAYCDGNNWKGFEYVYPVGQDFYQPVTLRVRSDGNLEFELLPIPNNSAVYNDFYQAPRGAVRIGSIIAEWDGTGTPPANNWTDTTSYHCTFWFFGCVTGHTDHVYTQNGLRNDFGYSRVEGIQIQYFRVATRGL